MTASQLECKPLPTLSAPRADGVLREKPVNFVSVYNSALTVGKSLAQIGAGPRITPGAIGHFEGDAP
jgi:hypothetical protein